MVNGVKEQRGDRDGGRGERARQRLRKRFNTEDTERDRRARRKRGEILRPPGRTQNDGQRHQRRASRASPSQSGVKPPHSREAMQRPGTVRLGGCPWAEQAKESQDASTFYTVLVLEIEDYSVIK